MSKIVYILGAGASFGKRSSKETTYTINEHKHEKIFSIQRGAPIVNEFARHIEHIYCQVLHSDFEKGFQYPAKLEQRKILVRELKWLLGICRDYPTVDTYARLLYVTKQEAEYQRLKNAISLFLTLCQHPTKRDIRYDGFIASIIKDDNTFPSDISILSWNYDSQMEFAYAGYLSEHSQDINNIWRNMNVLNKVSNHQLSDGFGIVKLNGTAHFYDPTNQNQNILDVYYKTQGSSITNLMSMHCLNGMVNVKNTLSFAWEYAVNHDLFNTAIKNRASDAEVLVVIGYSFPYVNRSMDKMILTNMSQLKHIYIQDPNADAIRERVTAIIPAYVMPNIKTTVYKDTAQFIVPSELE